MLTEQDFIKIERQAIGIYQDLELQIIEEIATRIANFGYANTVVLNDIKIAKEMGFLYQDTVRLVAEYNNTSFEKINQIFYEAGEKSLKFDDKIYKEAGLNPVPLKSSKSIRQIMEATILKTAGNLQNLCMTTANTTQTQFYNAINRAYMEVSTGVKSYSQAIIDAISNISTQGGYIVYPSGKRMSIESAVRANIITGVNQTCGKLQETRANEIGWDLMELTAHSGARPEHANWQGKIVSLSGKKGYLSKKDIGYGEATGFKGINCRHDWYPYSKGSIRTYTQEQLDKWKNEKVIYNGQEYSKYEASQIQRRLERQIRSDKKEIVGLQGILTSNNKDDKLIKDTKAQLINKQNKLKLDNTILNDFIKQTNIKKDYNRLYIRNKVISNELSNNEKYALNSYISSESYKINEALRNDLGLSKEQRKVITNLDKALSKCNNYNGNVVRVLEIEDSKKLKEFIRTNKINKPISFKEYLSFSNKTNYNSKANVIIFTVSTKAKDLRKFNPEESEILYPRNSRFIVENVKKVDDKYYLLWREI